MSKFVVIDGTTGESREMSGNPVLTKDASEKNRKELENYLSYVAGNQDLLESITTIKMSYSIFGGMRPIDSLPQFRIDRIKTLTEKILKKILSGKMKVDGTRGNWSNGFLGSRWFDIDSASVALTCRVCFYSRKELGKSAKNPYLLGLCFEEREVVDCSNPECRQHSKWFKKCSCCHSAQYCGEACQKADWKRHKAEMKEQKEEDDE